MSLETGDIAINTKWPGHVMLVLEGHANGDKVQIVHGTNSGNFKITSNMALDGGMVSYLVRNETWVFRPPWELYGVHAEYKKRELQQIAKAMARSAKYGKYRAVRLFLGDSNFGPDARARLVKYHQRKQAFIAGGSDKFVSTITCAESVILCYQLTFYETQKAPFFILKDAAHTMPVTLKEWLEGNGWTTVQRGN
jgi:hypothetical protein